VQVGTPAERPEHPRSRPWLLYLIVAALIAAVAVIAAHRPDHQQQSSAELSIGRTALDPNQVADAARRSIVAYWSRELPSVYGRQFQPLAAGFQAKTPSSPPFECGGQRQTYNDLRGNAFYCPSGDYIAYDAADLFPRLDKQFGAVAPAIVLAHEMGHAIQARAQVQAASVVMELQADCFAGSWTKYAETSTDDPVTLADGALDSAIAAILTLRDRPGNAATAAQAHGLGFDRVNAFQTGYGQGAGSCAAFPQQGVVTTELPFRTTAEQQSGGNLPLDQAVQVLSTSLDNFWTAALPQVAAGKRFAKPVQTPVESGNLPDCPDNKDSAGLSEYCASTRTVAWLVPAVAQLHQRIGDLATGTILSEAWAEAAQQQAGLPTTGQQAGLQRDCFTGAWIASLAAGNLATSPLSPGDLDEALATVVATSFGAAGQRLERGGAFARAQSLRTGVLNGLGSCS
jgi:predicted metalloprotease